MKACFILILVCDSKKIKKRHIMVNLTLFKDSQPSACPVRSRWIIISSILIIISATLAGSVYIFDKLVAWLVCRGPLNNKTVWNPCKDPEMSYDELMTPKNFFSTMVVLFNFYCVIFVALSILKGVLIALAAYWLNSPKRFYLSTICARGVSDESAETMSLRSSPIERAVTVGVNEHIEEEFPLGSISAKKAYEIIQRSRLVLTVIMVLDIISSLAAGVLFFLNQVVSAVIVFFGAPFICVISLTVISITIYYIKDKCCDVS
jgi:hypothetical protein